MCYYIHSVSFQKEISTFYEKFKHKSWDMLFFGSFWQANYSDSSDNSIAVKPFQINQATAYLINEHYFDYYQNYLWNSYQKLLEYPADVRFICDQMWNEKELKNDQIYVLQKKLVGQCINYSNTCDAIMLGGHPDLYLNN